VAAAGQAEVVAGDLHPLVLGRGCQHPLQKLVVALLQLITLIKRALRLADPLRQRIANRLQLAEVEDTGGTGGRGDRSVDLEPLEALADQGAELHFEVPDLAPQLRPREPLVATRAKHDPAVSVEQIRHTHHRV
jgi:hypothetical protein